MHVDELQLVMILPSWVCIGKEVDIYFSRLGDDWDRVGQLYMDHYGVHVFIAETL